MKAGVWYFTLLEVIYWSTLLLSFQFWKWINFLSFVIVWYFKLLEAISVRFHFLIMKYFKFPYIFFFIVLFWFFSPVHTYCPRKILGYYYILLITCSQQPCDMLYNGIIDRWLHWNFQLIKYTKIEWFLLISWVSGQRYLDIWMKNSYPDDVIDCLICRYL